MNYILNASAKKGDEAKPEWWGKGLHPEGEGFAPTEAHRWAAHKWASLGSFQCSALHVWTVS